MKNVNSNVFDYKLPEFFYEQLNNLIVSIFFTYKKYDSFAKQLEGELASGSKSDT
jgi:hypothetical protein